MHVKKWNHATETPKHETASAHVIWCNWGKEVLEYESHIRNRTQERCSLAPSCKLSTVFFFFWFFDGLIYIQKRYFKMIICISVKTGFTVGFSNRRADNAVRFGARKHRIIIIIIVIIIVELQPDLSHAGVLSRILVSPNASPTKRHAMWSPVIQSDLAYVQVKTTRGWV